MSSHDHSIPFRSWSLDDVRDYVARFGRNATAIALGSWTLAQILYHLAAAFEMSFLKRDATQPVSSRLLKWPVRIVVLRWGLPPGRPMPEHLRAQLTPFPDADLNSERARLLPAINTFERDRHALRQHPVLGNLTYDEWRQFHLRHGEHHLRLIRL